MSGFRATVAGQLSPRKKCWQKPLSPSPAGISGCFILISINLQTLFNLTHSTCVPTQPASSGFSIQTTYLGSCWGHFYNLSKVQKSKTSKIWLQHALYFLLSGHRLALAAAGLGSFLGLSQTPPSLAQVAPILQTTL